MSAHELSWGREVIWNLRMGLKKGVEGG
jgi:hypothetical protein